MRPIKFVIFWISATILITGFRLIYVQLQFEAEELAFLYENVVNKSQESYLGIPESVLLHRKSCHDCYKITCSELLFNPSDNDARRTAHYFMTKYNPTILNENDIISLTQNCDVFKKSRNFVLEPLSIEESDFPLAFTILVHRDVAQVERLLRALYAPQNVYCIHIDAKADASIHAALKSLVKCFNNVFIASKIERVVYAGISRLLADINCMKDHLKSSVKWRYLINTAGQAFPLKTNLEMVQILKVYNGSNDIEGLYGRKYLEFRYVNEWKETYLDTDHPKLEKTGQKHQPLPHNLGFVKGSSYGIFSRKFVEYIIDNPVAKDLLVWSSSTWSPDEHYWAILHHTYSNPHIKPPGSYSGFPDAKPFHGVYAAWYSVDNCHGRWQRGCCVFGLDDIPLLINRKEFFANKFEISFQPLALECLGQWILHKQFHPPRLDLTYYQNLPFVKQQLKFV